MTDPVLVDPSQRDLKEDVARRTGGTHDFGAVQAPPLDRICDPFVHRTSQALDERRHRRPHRHLVVEQVAGQAVRHLDFSRGRDLEQRHRQRVEEVPVRGVDAGVRRKEIDLAPRAVALSLVDGQPRRPAGESDLVDAARTNGHVEDDVVERRSTIADDLPHRTVPVEDCAGPRRRQHRQCDGFEPARDIGTGGIIETPEKGVGTELVRGQADVAVPHRDLLGRRPACVGLHLQPREHGGRRGERSAQRPQQAGPVRGTETFPRRGVLKADPAIAVRGESRGGVVFEKASDGAPDVAFRASTLPRKAEDDGRNSQHAGPRCEHEGRRRTARDAADGQQHETEKQESPDRRLQPRGEAIFG